MPTQPPQNRQPFQIQAEFDASKSPFRVWAVMAVALLLTGIFVGCQTSTSGNDTSVIPVSAGSFTNTLQEGDVIQITFEGATNLNTTIKIPFDGMVLLPFVGRVKAAGKATPDLENDLTGLYAAQVKSTKIGVMVMSSAAAVYVSGAVLRPGKIPLDRQLTVLDAVMETGGVDHNRAKLSSVSVLRVENGRQRIYHFDLKRALAGKEPVLFYLKPFDIIYVPEKTFTF